MRRNTRPAAPLLILATLVAGPATLTTPPAVRACLWDRDTLDAEAKGIPDVVHIIAGRFERNPPLFYEMRLARAGREVAARPDDLALYDDAAVACDRLRRADEAIAWMAHKRAALDRLAASSAADSAALRDHEYRYLANLGTFHAHRWLRAGADRKETADLRRARALLERAIVLNPGAHFGREKYQLKAVKWLLNPPKAGDGFLPNFLGIEPGNPPSEDKGELRRLAMPDAVRGVSGLIVLGDAWESVDVFHALANALQAEGRSSVARLARYRRDELLREGRRSVLGFAADERWGRINVPRPDGGGNYDFPAFYEVENNGAVEPALEAMFRDLRDEADSWSRARTEYMIPLLRTGRHPDTDPTFWNGRRPTPPPSLWMTPPGYVTVLGVTLNPTQQLGAVTASVAAVLTVAGVGTALGLRRARRRRSSHSPAT